MNTQKFIELCKLNIVEYYNYNNVPIHKENIVVVW